MEYDKSSIIDLEEMKKEKEKEKLKEAIRPYISESESSVSLDKMEMLVE